MTAGPEAVRAAVLYSREACALCFTLRRLAQRSARRHGMKLIVLDIDSDAGLRSRYAEQVPVLQLPGAEPIFGCAGAGTVDEAFRRAVARVRGARVTDAGPSGPGAPWRRVRLAWIRRALGLDPGTTPT